MALKRALRLRKSSDFQRVRQQGRSSMSRLLILAWTPNEQAILRVGFVISKRISKQAVKRNHVKRLLGEAVRPVVGRLPTGFDIVFTARNQAADADLATLTEDIVALLGKARLLAPIVEAEPRS